MTAQMLTNITSRLIKEGLISEWRREGLRGRHRQLYLTPRVAEDLELYWARLSNETPRRREARDRSLYSVLKRWLDGGQMFYEDQIKALTPWEDGIWEFKASFPKPAKRLLGFIPDVNVFVAVGFYSRGYLGEGRQSRWADATAQALCEWDRLYDNAVPLCCPETMRDAVGLRSFWNDKDARV